ncbi:nuclear mitotic apparatus protein 1 isoform X2 [Chiloscyllium plagiosum]|uniref:nuclear mitotic apparatus protein 1 isoform X2 n=1 Tax=Chiloscyllium plagiosum TaxID=36176 RepID=UPI001CB7F7A7|nr:nuclear mitotic apparatus protein 1 isoform X2 [Chiloscyllium plagiosum]
MAVHRTKAEALVKWINSLKLSKEVENLSDLQDGVIFINIVCRISGKENAQQLIEQKTIEERFQFICNFLECSEVQKTQSELCRYNPAAGSVVSWQKILNSEDVELEMAKVAVFLLHLHTMAKQNPWEFESLDIDTQGELVGMLRYILDNEEAIYLDNNLVVFLRSRATSPVARLFSASSDETNSPPISEKTGGHKTKFLTSSVYSSAPSNSPTSPMRDFMQTPLVQVRRMKRQLADARTLRDDLEIELTEARKLLTEKETQISIMQQKIERLVKLTEKQTSEEDSDELSNMRDKHESVLNRLRDAQKQCQDLKTEKNQTERKIDKLEEENGDLSYKVRDLNSRLAQSQKALNELADEHEAAIPLWEGKQKQLESDLCVTLSDKKLLEEKVQILEGKISLMEDQLKAAGESSSEMKGEVMGDILQLEVLKTEISQLTAKTAELEQESSLHKEEKSQLAETIRNLEQSISDLVEQKDQLEQDARVQEDRLTGQLDALNVEIMKLNNSLMQKDLELEEEKKLRRQLADDSQSKEKTVLDLDSKVQTLNEVLRSKEEALKMLEKEVSAERENMSQQVATLKEESQQINKEKASILSQYDTLKTEKEAELNLLTEEIKALKSNQLEMEDLRSEKDSLSQKVQELCSEVAEVGSKNQSLQSVCETHKQRHAEEVAALKIKLQETEGMLEEHRIRLAGLDASAQNVKNLQEQLTSLQGTVEALENEKKQWEEGHAREAERYSQLANEVKGLTEERNQARTQLAEELKRQEVVGAQMKQTMDEQVERCSTLQSELSDALRKVEEKEKEEARLCENVASWKEKFEVVQHKQVQGDELIACLKEEREKAQAELSEEKAKSNELETRINQLNNEEERKASALEKDLCDALSQIKEKEALRDQAQAEVLSWQDKFETAQKEASQRLSQVEEAARQNSHKRDQIEKELFEAREKVAHLEDRVNQAGSKQQDQISKLEADLAKARQVAREEAVQSEELRGEVEALHSQLAELRKSQSECMARVEEKQHKLSEEKDAAKVELEAERASKLDMETRLQQSINEQQERLVVLQSEVSSARTAREEIETKEKLMRSEIERWQDQSRHQQARINELQTEVSTMKNMKEKIISQEREMLRYAEVLSKKEEELHELSSKLAAGDDAIRQHKQRMDSAEKELSKSRNLCQERLSSIEALKSQVAELELKCKGQQDVIARLETEKTAQGSHSHEHMTALQGELSLVRGLLKEKESMERALKEKVSLHLEELAKQKEKVRALELEIPTWQLKSSEEQKENAKLRDKVAVQVEVCRKLQETIDALRAEQASEAQKRNSAEEATKLQNTTLKMEIAAQKQAAEKLQEELTARKLAEATLERQAQADKEQSVQMEQELLQLRGQMAEIQSTMRASESQHQGELEQQKKLLNELKAETRQLPSLKERCKEQEREIQRLQQSSSQLSSESGLACGKLEAELARAREAHAKELSHLKSCHAEQEAASKAKEEESRKRVEEATSKYEKAKLMVLDERRRFQDEQQKLSTQVEELQKKLATENQKVVELNQKLAQQDTTAKSKLQKLKARDSDAQEKLEQQVEELHAQLEKKEEVVQHVKAQLDKAKTHYDSKKVLNLELTQKLEASKKDVTALEEQLTTVKQECVDLRTESEQLRQDLQQSAKELKEANQKNKTLSAQVDFTDRQLRELKSGQTTESVKSRVDTRRGSSQAEESEADFSKDSIELSDLEETTMTWENTGGRRGKQAYKTPVAAQKRAGSRAAQKQRGSQESLESLYFTPLPSHNQSKMDISLSSLGDLSLDSGKKTRSGRRRTTQVINILMTKETVDQEGASTSSTSVLGTRSSTSQPNLLGRPSRGGRRNRPTSTISLPIIDRSMSQDSLDSSSNAEDLGAATLMNLPGYRPSTRRSTRLSTFGSVASGSSSLYPGSCQDEPDQLEDWNRIAELQRRNGVCPPHLKTSYPLESNTATNESMITEDELRLGDPQETLRRATLLPQQIKEMSTSRLKRLSTDSQGSNWKGVTTRQRKRLSEESHQGSGTPEAKKQLSCFPRPLTPKEKVKRVHSLFDSQAKRPTPNKAKNQTDRRKSISYTVLNTPRKLGNTLLRGINKRATPKKTPKKSPKKSPRSNSKKDVGRRKASKNMKM